MRDCPVEGGCSLKRPDLALDFGTHVVVIEVDEAQHDEASCWDEDTRLAVIAADFQKPIAVIRLRVDTPVPCFRQKRMSNGEPTWAAIAEPFSLIMSRAEAAKGRVMVPKMCPIEGLFVCITLDGVAQRDITYDFRTPR